MNKRGMRTPQPQARRPSQRRLTNEQVTLPARLVHLRHLPWLGCYQRQLQTENKSDNTQKSYFYGLRPLIETTLPREDVLDEATYEALPIGHTASQDSNLRRTTLELPPPDISSNGSVSFGQTTFNEPAPGNAFHVHSREEN
jgi:hypothetical protein